MHDSTTALPSSKRCTKCEHCGKVLRSDAKGAYCAKHRKPGSRMQARHCAHEGCGKKLSTINKTAYCRGHRHPRDRGEHAQCAIGWCDKLLDSKNRLGKCRAHRFVRLVMLCAYAPCGNPLKSNNPGEYCHLHVRPGSRLPVRYCGVEWCDVRIFLNNKSGYCQDHQREQSRSVPRRCAREGCGKRLMWYNSTGLCRDHCDSTHDANRRALKANALFETVSIQKVWDQYSGVCHLCGAEADPDDWHIEHVVPLSRGGAHSYQNCAVSHPECNLRKFNSAAPSALGLRGAYVIRPVTCNR